MSTQKKGFGDFVRSPAPAPAEQITDNGFRDAPAARQRSDAPAMSPVQPPAPNTSGGSERIREVTSTGRVRTYSATRQLPGITLRVTEERWEKLKMMSIQERRPLQEILGEALDRYMKERGLPW